MSHIIYNVAAKCDKAGRSQNQDNYWVCPNLEKIGDISNVGNDHDIELSAKGALLVVADGMGGMKSGEKASEFVIEGIKKKFSNIPEDILGNDNAIISFIKEAIVESDGIIKAYAKDHRESEGMGSTIVLVWLLGEKAYCGWCGDSRIYCYNPQNTLVRLSHDHSYVQSLVDEGKISEEDAFDHPDGNIITRSLGDSGEKANPETKIYPIHRRDVFLLCSDGLCGLLTDENIESLLSDNCTSSEDALKALWQAGEKEGWSDNVTIEVACVTDGGATPTRKAVGYSEKKPQPLSEGKSDGIKKDTNLMPNFWANNKQYIIIVGVVALIAIGLIWYFSIDKKTKGSSNQEFNVEQPTDNTPHNSGNDNNSNDENNHEEGNTPVVSPPSKPNKPSPQPSPGSSNSNSNQHPGGNNNTNPNITIPGKNENNVPQKVSEGYLNMLRDTYRSINSINTYITNAQNSRHFRSAEANALHDFIENARELNSKPDVKVLSEAQKNVLATINGIAKKASNALRLYKVYDEENNPHQSQPSRHHEDPYEDPIYRNV